MGKKERIEDEEEPGPSSRCYSSRRSDCDDYNSSSWSDDSDRLTFLERIFSTFTCAEWQLLGIFAVADFIAGMVYNIKGPFYPKEAESKGVTPTQYGFVFGIFDITKVFVCPLLGKHMSFLGPKRVFIFSMILISVCSIAFGLLDKLSSSAAFLALSLFIRVAEAVGSSGFSTSTFSIIALAFPTRVATTFASLETFFGVGLIVGPLLGGVLYQLGGYDAPFIITGLLLFLAAVGIFFLMDPPKAKSSTGFDESLKEDSAPFGVLDLLKISGISLSAFNVFSLSTSAGFMNATLEPHIRQFSLNPLQVGVVFVIYGAVYAMTAPIWGYFCDRVKQPKFISLAGGGLNFLAFLAMGPAPFIPAESQLWFTCLGLVLHGLALGATFVSGFVLSLRYAVAHGYPNNMSTYGVISGMWTSALSLGMFVGPVVGGFLLDQVGFRWGTLYVLVNMIIMMASILAFLSTQGVTIRKLGGTEAVPPPDAKAPLLRSKSVFIDSSTEAQVLSYGSGSTT